MSALDVALVVLRLGVGVWLLVALRRVVATAESEPEAPARVDGDVSVVVPARDEQESLPSLLGSLPPGLDVVVVDDGSSDETAVVAGAGARVVPAGPVPEGWVGKSWACARGAEVVAGDPLVFVDADVRFGPGGLDAVLQTLHANGGLVSIQPHHEPVRAAEHLALLFNVIGVAGTDAGSPLGRRRGPRGAFGPVLATARADLDGVGGHAAVRSSVVEDLALAARYRDAGLPVTVLAGGDAVRFRMYPRGLGQLVEGFTKNLAGGFGAIRRSTALLVVVWSTLLVQAAVAPVRAVFAGPGPTGDGGTVAAALYVAVAAQLWWMGRRVGRFSPWVPALFPVSVALFIAVFARSVWGAWQGEVSWRGRRVPTRGRPR